MNDRESTGRCLAPRSLRTSLCLQFEAWKIANGYETSWGDNHHLK